MDMKWIRPIISIMFAAGIMYGFVTKLIEPKDFLIIAAVAIYWWYEARSKEKAK